MKFVCQKLQTTFQELTFDTYKISKNLTLIDQHFHSPSSDWRTLTSYFIPPLIELKKGKLFSEFQIWTWVYLQQSSFTPEFRPVHLGGRSPRWGFYSSKSLKNTIIKVQNDHFIVLSKVFIEHHHLPCML